MKDFNTYTGGNVRVEFVELGEGRDGDYDPEDPNDVEFLRFDVYVSEAIATEHDRECGGTEIDGTTWYPPQDSSYCSNVPVSATPQQRQDLLVLIHAHVGEPPAKRRMEAASWFGLDLLV